MAKFVTKEMVEKARQIDLYSYMEVYEPDNLVRVCAGTYQLREHDSVKISNGLWVQKSTGIGGRSALDYLVKVRGLSFQDAVEQVSGMAAPEVNRSQKPVREERREFRLPPKNSTTFKVERYLKSRGIDDEIVRHCVDSGLIFEAAIHHNIVFVGFDFDKKTPRYATQRGCGTAFKGEASGSDKRFGFCLECANSETVHVFEAPIDLLSYATLLKRWGQNWRAVNLLSLGGVAARKDGGLPVSLEQYLLHRNTKKVILHLDNDGPGRAASASILAAAPADLTVEDRPPPTGKDVNDYLCQQLGISEKTPSHCI